MDIHILNALAVIFLGLLVLLVIFNTASNTIAKLSDYKKFSEEEKSEEKPLDKSCLCRHKNPLDTILKD